MYTGERLNSITHLVGAVLALIGFGALLTISIQQADALLIFSFTLFGLTLVLLYTMSTLYHSFHPPQLKQLFRKLDHVSIYLLIAGTYAPYMLVSIRDEGGITMFIAIWVLALLGLLIDIFMRKRLVMLSVTIYLVMGWICTFNLGGIRQALPNAAILWLTAGGIAYTAGVVFYVLDKLKKLRHAHGIWHLFVLAGSTCHFISIAGYVR